MYTTKLVAGLVCVTTALASPWGPWGNNNGNGPWNGPWGYNGNYCLNQTGVDTLVNGYTYLLEHPGGPDFNSTALAILSDQFVVYSDSINTLSQRPLGQPAYPSRDIYIATQFLTPALPVVQTLQTFYNCDQIAWRWNASGIGSNQYEILGIITMNVNPNTTQIDALYSEFNTAAFEADLGYPECKHS